MKAGNAARDIPIIGMNRHIVIADTEAEALEAVSKTAIRVVGSTALHCCGSARVFHCRCGLYRRLRRSGSPRLHHRGNAKGRARDDRPLRSRAAASIT